MGYLTDPDDPADLDEFLIITYTRAAAAELRGKIAARLGEMLAEDPDNKHLQRQLTRVYLAQISTVHAFCQTVLRQYAAEADLPADFRVADEQQAAALRAEALQDTLAELYAGLDVNPDFAAMIDTLGYGRDDRRLLALAEESYGVMRCQVDPRPGRAAACRLMTCRRTRKRSRRSGARGFCRNARACWKTPTRCSGRRKISAGGSRSSRKNAPPFWKKTAPPSGIFSPRRPGTAAWKKRSRPSEPCARPRTPKPSSRSRPCAKRPGRWSGHPALLLRPSRQVTDDLRRTVPALRGLLALLKAF